MRKTMKWLSGLTLAIFLAFGIQHWALAQHTGFYERPIPMGVSISTTPSDPYIFAGTAGMLVRSLSIPANIPIRFILSNNHVMGAVGPTLCPDSAPRFTRILQPGTLDIGFDPGSDPEFVVGFLSHAIPIRFGGFPANQVDAAIAITSPRLASEEIEGIGFPVADIGTPIPGMNVIKSGRTTGVTTGSVESVNATVSVSYHECGTARFVDQVIFGRLSESGDSGAVILESGTLKPVALLFAGGATNTIGNTFENVADALGIFPVGGEVLAAEPESVEELVKKLEKKKRNPRLERLMGIQRRHEARIMDVPHVVGIGIGLGEHGEDFEFIVYCDEPVSVVEQKVPKILEGVPVRLKQSGTFEAY